LQRSNLVQVLQQASPECILQYEPLGKLGIRRIRLVPYRWFSWLIPTSNKLTRAADHLSMPCKQRRCIAPRHFGPTFAEGRWSPFD